MGCSFLVGGGDVISIALHDRYLKEVYRTIAGDTMRTLCRQLSDGGGGSRGEGKSTC